MRTATQGRTGTSGAIIIVHDVVLGLVLAMAIIALLDITLMLVNVLTAMVVLVQMLIASTVATFVANHENKAIVAIVRPRAIRIATLHLGGRVMQSLGA